MSSLAQLYGLKLFQGKIQETEIPTTYKQDAISYCNDLKKQNKI